MQQRQIGLGAIRVALVMCLGMAVGCSSPVWLAVETRPEGSRVTVRGNPPTGISEKPAPLSVELKPESDNDVYVIQVAPPDAEADRWEPATLKMSAAELRALPSATARDADGPVRRLSVSLEKKPVALLITTKPASTQVAVKNTLGQPLAAGPGPLSVSFVPVHESEQITIEVKPDAALAERYQTREIRMTVGEIRRLQAMSGDLGRRRLDVDLSELNVALVVEAKPAQAKITVQDATGRVLQQGPAPLVMNLGPRGGSEVITFVAEPTGRDANRYQVTAKDLTFEYLRTMPRLNEESPGRVVVEIKEAPYVFVRELAIYHDPQGQLRAAVLPSRAFREITEVGSAVPTRIVEVGPDLTIEGLTLSPDDQRIAFAASDVAALSNEGEGGLVEATVRRSVLQAVRTEPGGGVQHITTDNFHDRFPTFTRDGKALLFASDRRRRDGQDILRISAEANRGGIADIFVDQRGALVSYPTTAANNTIGFMMDTRDTVRPGHRYQVWTVGGPNQFPTQIALGTEPSISPDGSRIAYIGNDGNLWVIGADGVGATQLTLDAERIREAYIRSLTTAERELFDAAERRGMTPVKPYASPTWSADGKLIAYAAMEGHDPTGRPNQDIWITRPDGTAKQQITSNGSADKFPLITRDSRSIYFMSNRGGHWAIWRIALPQVSG